MRKSRKAFERKIALVWGDSVEMSIFVRKQWRCYIYKSYSNENAYPVNCRHPQFQCSCREQLQKIRNKYHFTLMPKAVIVVE